MTPQPPEQPRTAAGRNLLELFFEDGGFPPDPASLILAIESNEAAAPDPVASPRWEEWARRLAPLVHDGLIDIPNERQIIDKAFALARLLDEHLPDPVASPAPLDPINVLILSWAIDEHGQAVPASEPVHDDGTCSDDCAGDIRARYVRHARLEGQPVAEDSE